MSKLPKLLPITNRYTVAIKYVVEHNSFDGIINLGFMITTRARFMVKNIPNVPFELYGRVKRRLSELVLGKVMTVETSKCNFHGVWNSLIYDENNVCINELMAEYINELMNTLKEVPQEEVAQVSEEV